MKKAILRNRPVPVALGSAPLAVCSLMQAQGGG
jgi:hypothetical protein